MRLPAVLLALAFLPATATHADDASVDMDLMQSIEDTHKSLSSNIALKDPKGSIGDAQELSRL